MTCQSIGNYRIVERLGHGGQGKVYRAIDTLVERQVAIKVLRPEIARDPEMLERFRAEAVALAKLNHPAIAQLYAFVCERGDFYMVMEYVPGRTLGELIRDEGPFAWPRAVSIAASILDAVAFAHNAGVLHRDLKPANVMLTSDDRVKVMDFGIAQIAGKRKMTREGRIVGTVEYLAPERIRGAAPDERSDLYSVGIVLYEMLTGRLPFEASTEYATMMAQLNERPAPPRQLGIEVPEALAAVLDKALEKDPDRRFPDAASFAAALRSVLAEAPPLAAPAVTPRVDRSRLIMAGAAAAAFLLVLLVSLLVLQYVREDPWEAARRLPPAEAPLIPSPEPTVSRPQPVPLDPTPIPVPAPVPRQTPAPAKPPAVKLQRPAPVPAPTEPVSRRQEPAAPAPSEPAPTPTPAPAPTPPPAPAPATPPARTEAPPRRSPGVGSIHDVRHLFVEETEGELSHLIRAELRERLGERLKIAASRGEADAIMQVTVEQLKGGTFSRAGRIFGVSDKRRIQARVVDASSGRTLWEERAGDRQILAGAFVGDAAHRLASRIAGALERDLR